MFPPRPTVFQARSPQPDESGFANVSSKDLEWSKVHVAGRGIVHDRLARSRPSGFPPRTRPVDLIRPTAALHQTVHDTAHKDRDGSFRGALDRFRFGLILLQP